MNDVRPVVVPQVNVNDEEVRLVQWLVSTGAELRVGEPVCIVETSKAATEIVSDVTGVFKPVVELEDMVRVGAALGYVGASLDMIERALSDRAKEPSSADTAGPTRSTPRAAALARMHGVDLNAVAGAGVIGAIKESDVQRFLDAQRGRRQPSGRAAVRDVSLPAALMNRVLPPDDVSRHQLSVIEGLRASQEAVILTTLDYDVALATITPRLQQAQRDGIKMSLQHLVIAALGRTLPRFPLLMSFRVGAQIYRYRTVDVAFVVRSLDGRLFTPVVRDAATLSVTDVAKTCVAYAMRVNRGRVTPDDLEGACFTVSHITDPAVSRFAALPNRFQSAILAVAGERHEAVTCTLSYDHALCDGAYAASFMKAVVTEMGILLP